MHIKQVTIEGFKSYREQIIADPFSPKINLIVGANGSGKSNFFHAIRFVLADLFVTLRQEERVALLHESTGPAVPSAYVEVLFDNTDKRIPVDRDEVRLKRVISAKKDEYFIDKKHVSKKEVADMLESAGFSKANPYYVVQQGKIMQMAKMSDEQRLNLLKEIGGAGTYEERRKESMKCLQETEAKTAQIDELLEDMNARMAELEAERKELEDYQDAERTRRCTEYMLLDLDKSKTMADLKQIDESTLQAQEEMRERQEEAAAAVNELERVGEAIQGIEARVEETAKLKDAAQEQLAKAIENHVAARSHRSELANGIEDDNLSRAHKELEVDQSRQQIRKAEADLERFRQKAAEAAVKETELSRAVQNKERRKAELTTKKGAKEEFTSKADRDGWLKDNVVKHQDVIKKTRSKQQKVEAEAKQYDGSMAALQKQKRQLEDRLKAEEAAQTAKEVAYREVEHELTAAVQKKTEVWRELNTVTQELKQLEGEADALRNDVNRAIPQDINKGLYNVRKWTAERNIPGVHGVVFELFQIKSSSLNTAVEVVAGNMLNNVVVDHASTATELAQMLYRTRGGRVTFLPLDTIRVPNLNPPKTQDAVPLARHLTAGQPIYQKVIDYVFGRTLLCRNMDLATQYSEDGQFDCVTIEGEKFSRNGTVSGGGHDPGRKGKLSLMYQSQKVTADIELKRQAKAELDRQAAELESNALETKKYKLKKEKESCVNAVLSTRNEIQEIEGKIRHLQHQKEKSLEAVARYQEKIAEVEAQVASTTALMDTPFDTQLTKEEAAELKALPGELKKLQDKLIKEQDSCRELKSSCTTLEAQLDEMREEVRKLQQELDDALRSAGDADVQAAKQAEDAAKEAEEAARARVQDLNKQMAKLKGEINELVRQKKQYEELIENVGDASQHQRHLQELTQQKVVLEEQLNDTQKKMRDVGSLSSEAIQKYKGKPAKELQRLQKRAQQQLLALSHVNKKALNQYALFTEQREDVLKRRQEQEADSNKIRELIDVLDRRKNEALQRTVRGVGVNFQEVFAALVPGGQGSLRMVTAANEDGSAAGGNRMEQMYIGVKIKVSFGVGEAKSLTILSGGQKTLVALALILAIQRCDPAPFYLFDEVDAALDPQYRTTVAEVLRRQADDKHNPCQFIITTFNTQLLEHADKIYGVTQRNRISQVDVITKDAAVEFLAKEGKAGEKRAENGETADGETETRATGRTGSQATGSRSAVGTEQREKRKRNAA